MKTTGLSMVLALLLMVAIARPVAAAAPEPTNWSQLSPPQQELLQRFEADWDTLPAARQQALQQREGPLGARFGA